MTGASRGEEDEEAEEEEEGLFRANAENEEDSEHDCATPLLQRVFMANRNWNIRSDVRANGRAKRDRRLARPPSVHGMAPSHPLHALALREQPGSVHVCTHAHMHAHMHNGIDAISRLP